MGGPGGLLRRRGRSGRSLPWLMIDAGTREWTKVPGGARPETGTRKRMGRAEDVARRRRRRKEAAAALEGGQDPGWGCELRGCGAEAPPGQT